MRNVEMVSKPWSFGHAPIPICGDVVGMGSLNIYLMAEIFLDRLDLFLSQDSHTITIVCIVSVERTHSHMVD